MSYYKERIATHREIREAVVKGLHNTITNMETYDAILESAADRADDLREDVAALELRAALRAMATVLPLVKSAHKKLSKLGKEKDGSHNYGTLGDGTPPNLLKKRHEAPHEASPYQRSARQSHSKR